MSLPQTLGRYTILGELGRGAMGVVYQASDPMLNRTVAIKTINVAADPEERAEYEKRFYQEAKAAGGLSHPNIVTIFDIGHAGDLVYMAMEFVAGSELKSLLASHLVEPQAALDIGAQIAEGLAYAHSRGVVHRDVKPANIMVVPGGPAKIMDFGIARMRSSDVKTQTGMLLGSPKYMAPEQLLGGTVDHRCDIFALGVVIYEMAVGASPFSGDDITQIMYQIVNAAPPAPSAVHARLPAMLDLVLARALAKDPDRRYQDARELAADLRACGAQLAAAALRAPDDDDATQTLPIGAFSLPGDDDEKTIALPPPQRAAPVRDRARRRGAAPRDLAPVRLDRGDAPPRGRRRGRRDRADGPPRPRSARRRERAAGGGAEARGRARRGAAIAAAELAAVGGCYHCRARRGRDRDRVDIAIA